MNLQLTQLNLKRSILIAITAVFSSVLILVLYNPELAISDNQNLYSVINSCIALFSFLIAIFFYYNLKLNKKDSYKTIRYPIVAFVIIGIGSFLLAFTPHSLEMVMLFLFSIAICFPLVVKHNGTEERSKQISSVLFGVATLVLLGAFSMVLSSTVNEGVFFIGVPGAVIQFITGFVLIFSTFFWNKGITKDEVSDKLIAIVTLVMGLYSFFNFLAEIWSLAWWMLQTIKVLMFMSASGVMISFLFHLLMVSKREKEQVIGNRAAVVEENEVLKQQLFAVNSNYQKIDVLLSGINNSLYKHQEILENSNEHTYDEFALLQMQIGNSQSLIKGALSEVSKNKTSNDMFVSDNLRLLEAQFQKVGESFIELSGVNTIIHQVINLITEMEDQSNLLAINTAIEAIKAGELGKGMTVVADEIKVLAEMSKQATEQINGFFKNITQSSKKALQAAREGDAILEDVLSILQRKDSKDERHIETLNQIQDALGQILDAGQINHDRYIKMNDIVRSTNENMLGIKVDTERIHSLVNELKN